MSPLLTTGRPHPPSAAKREESDDDLFTVPDVECGPPEAWESAGTKHGGGGDSEGPSRPPNGGSPAEREYRRLKRLLRNRVSAQQARERKKLYVNDLESRAKDLHEQNMKLEEKISTVINENTMLRKVLMNTRPKLDGGEDQQTDKSGK